MAICIHGMFLVGLFAVLVVLTQSSADRLKDHQDFKTWMTKHGKVYRSVEEYLHRRDIYVETLGKVEKHNAEKHSYTLGLNEFSDLRDEEFAQRYLMQTPQHCSATRHADNTLRFKASPQSVPDAFDWRTKGVVSPVKNQGQCGSCWTFSTTGAMEAHMAIRYDNHNILSEQQLVDCAEAFDNHGCEGGLPSQAFEYIHYNHGLMSENTYPYHANETGKCLFSSKDAVAFVGSIVNITAKDEDELKVAIANDGPVSIAFMVASDFKSYKDGVYDSTVCKSDPMHVNHAVLTVGYNTSDAGEPYWIVKNSWGPDWGLDGYFNIARGKNMCGLADCASYPVVQDKP